MTTNPITGARGGDAGIATGPGDGVRCMLIRGGTSKGAFFLASDLPADPHGRDDLLLRILGSPDARQIDGIGGAQPVTSKVAVVSPSTEPGIDVDYLFLQVGIEHATVADRQTCGNLLAAVGQFAVERGLVAPCSERTSVRIRMVNTGAVAVSRFATPGGRVDYRDVSDTTIPKTTLVSPPRHGGAITTRTFIPLRPHPAIGVLGAVSVATATLLEGAVGHEMLVRPAAGPLSVEHPSGALQAEVDIQDGPNPQVRRSTVIRTARLLFDGIAFPRAGRTLPDSA